MPATLHIYTENALRYTAKHGALIGGSNWQFAYDPTSKLFFVPSTSTSSAFDGTFNKPLKASTVSGGVTTQTGLFDSGITPVSNTSPLYFLGAYGDSGTNYTQELLSYTYTSTTGALQVHKLGSQFIGPTWKISCRSMVLCYNDGADTENTTTLYQQSYAICLIDFGETITPASNELYGRYVRWLSGQVWRMSLA